MKMNEQETRDFFFFFPMGSGDSEVMDRCERLVDRCLKDFDATEKDPMGRLEQASVMLEKAKLPSEVRTFLAAMKVLRGMDVTLLMAVRLAEWVIKSEPAPLIQCMLHNDMKMHGDAVACVYEWAIEHFNLEQIAKAEQAEADASLREV